MEGDFEKYKDDFFSLINHEFRAPLHPILNSAQALLIKKHEDPEVSRLLKVIKRCGEGLAHKLNGVIEYHQLVEGEIRLNEIDIELSKFLSSFSENAEELCNSEGRVFKHLNNLDLSIQKKVFGRPYENESNPSHFS